MMRTLRKVYYSVSAEPGSAGSGKAAVLARIRCAALIVWSTALPGIVDNVFAETLEIDAELSVEFRGFLEAPAYLNQLTGIQSSVAIEPEFQWEANKGTQQVRVVPFARFDTEDEERTHVDVREAYWRRVKNNWELLIGANRVFWGVAESRHLVNVINQVDGVEDTDEEDFLGQFMVQLARDTRVGRFEAFLMTGFRERPFAGRDGRLRAPVPVDVDRARYTSGSKEWRPEIALRYSHFLGEIDIGLHIFHGTGREPRFMPGADGQALIPIYEPIAQLGVDLQLTREAWLWKFEGLVRDGQGDTFGAAVAGLEYSFFQIAGAADLGVIVEGLYDGRDNDVFPTLFDRDVFVGARLALNDVQNTSLLAGLVADIDDGLSGVRLEAARRIRENYRIELEAQIFLESDPTNPAALFERDDFIALTVSRFF